MLRQGGLVSGDSLHMVTGMPVRGLLLVGVEQLLG